MVTRHDWLHLILPNLTSIKMVIIVFACGDSCSVDRRRSHVQTTLNDDRAISGDCLGFLSTPVYDVPDMFVVSQQPSSDLVVVDGFKHMRSSAASRTSKQAVGEGIIT